MILKSGDITLLTKVCIIKVMVFPVVMYECESWTIKKAEPQRIDAFELRCWRRLLRVPWTARRSNQSILKEINPEYSLEGLMLKLKLQYFGHLMWRANSLEKTLLLAKIEGRRRKGRQRMRWLDGITDSWTWVWGSSGSWWWTGKPGILQSVGSQRVRLNWATKQLLSLVAPMVKNPPSVQDTWVWSLGQEDPLGKEMATHSSILAQRIPWTEEPGGLQSMRLQRASHDRATKHTRTTLQGTAIE